MRLHGPARSGPFLVVLALGLLASFVLPGSNSYVGWFVGAFSCAALMAGLWWLDTRRTDSHLAAREQRYRDAFTEAREVAQAGTDLVAAVSHDVRTPLSTIGAYVQLLEAGEGGELTEDQRTMLGVIEQNVRRAYQITDDLLALGQVEHAASTCERETVVIGDVLERVVRAIEPNARERGQRLSLLSELGDARIAGYAGQLDRMLGNLLTNAVKFTPEGGTISVHGFERGAEVVLSVTDSGTGIAEAEQEHIFERFYRTDHSRKNHVPGTGLGLAIVSEIVAVHGGSISVRSTPGHGATFSVTLPALAASMASRAS